jgi:hypothetical protein
MTHSKLSGIRVAMLTAVVGTVFIAAGAFWLSFTSLADLARRSGLDAEQAWAWPLIVDGIIVVATVAVVVLAGSRGAWYPWALLFIGALISVTGNALHAIVTATSEVPLMLAAAVAAVPPLVLLAITHLTSVLARHATVSAAAEPTLAPEVQYDVVVTEAQAKVLIPEPGTAAELSASGWSNRAIAHHLGVHPSTVGRWLRDRVIGTEPQEELAEGS